MTDDKTPAFTPDPATNRIRCLVHQWMSVWDRNDGNAGPLLDLLSPEGFAIHTSESETPISTIDGVRKWFGAFGRMVKADVHRVESVEITPRAPERFDVKIAITAPGVTAEDKPFVAHSKHEWEVVEYGGALPRIVSIRVALSMG